MKNNKQLIIITPVYQESLNNEEMASVVFAQKNLKDYDKAIVAPIKLSNNDEFIEFWKKYGYRIVFFENKYFEGIRGYNKLMLSLKFYKYFIEYEYMLIDQLDALILSDSLDEWLKKDVDYIGAPWISEGKKIKLETVGNGGLSLRRIKTFINVLESKKIFFDSNIFISIPARAGILNLLLLKVLIWLNPYVKVLNKRALFLFFFTSNEDLFWSFFSQFFIQKFTIPDVNEALKFAFESHPQFCYGENGHCLPFGVHAWFKHDSSFWINQFPELEQYIRLNKRKRKCPDDGVEGESVEKSSD